MALILLKHYTMGHRKRDAFHPLRRIYPWIGLKRWTGGKQLHEANTRRRNGDPK